jgi:glycosyltransferase involved in cell wall biosynthesis
MADAIPFPILVKVWAGAASHDFRYIARSLPSLLESDLPGHARVVLIDDCSPDPRVARFLARCSARYPHVEVRTNPRRLGPNGGQAYNFPRLVDRFPDAPYYVLCDDDIIYHPGWLGRLIRVHDEARDAGLRGVFTALNVPIRPGFGSARLPTGEVLLKERQAALNWLLPRDVYEAVGPFRDVGIAYDTDYCDRMAALGLPVICLRPSYVQNIGYHGAYQDDETYTAGDYVGRRDAYLRSRDLVYRLRRAGTDWARRVRDRLVPIP